MENYDNYIKIKRILLILIIGSPNTLILPTVELFQLFLHRIYNLIYQWSFVGAQLYDI